MSATTLAINIKLQTFILKTRSHFQKPSQIEYILRVWLWYKYKYLALWWLTWILMKNEQMFSSQWGIGLGLLAASVGPIRMQIVLLVIYHHKSDLGFRPFIYWIVGSWNYLKIAHIYTIYLFTCCRIVFW